NRTLEKGVARFGDEIQVVWQTGKIYFEEVNVQVEATGQKNITVLPFIARMDLAYGVADVIISRAGAGTISELAVAGKPVILVPSPNVAEDHQTRNALALVNRNAAIHVPDKLAESMLVEECLRLFNDKAKMTRLAGNIMKMAVPDAAKRIAEEIFKLV
ncbi:MAG TPA: glycosyltransferase, partial [Bacteroidales bacterium]|nr:glycosyltransferase [Bacteroidales bacterium]